MPSYFKELIEELNSDGFVSYLRELTGINNLIADHDLEGGGLHQSANGGFLNVHADFTVHPHKKNWKRRINLLMYFNSNWQPQYGGDLEFWDSNMVQCETKIAPLINRCVIFKTDEKSYHGFPDPIKIPKNRNRKSLALYYFTVEEDTPKRRATNYQARPTDGAKGVLIYLDKTALSAYNWIKGKLGLSDDFVSNILKRFNQK